MGHNFLLDFVKNITPKMLELAKQIEDTLYDQPQASLMQARLYTEQLVKMISDMEGIETIYPLKHSERIHKLYRTNAIEEAIYVKLEWIRKKGNKAAHEFKEVHIQDVLQAHRFIYDISVWYMQIFVNHDFEAPLYKEPEKSKGNDALNSEKIEEMVKPIIENKLQQVDEMWAEVQRELAYLKQEKAKQMEPSKKTTVGVSVTKTEYPLIQYLEEHNLSYIDKRDKGGALWVIGGWEINKFLLELKKHKIYFRFSKKGGRVTKNKPAWFLLNKSFIGSAEATVEGQGNLQTPIQEIDEAQTQDEVEAILTQSDDNISQPMATLDIIPDDFWSVKEQIKMPVHLKSQLFREWVSPHFGKLSAAMQVTEFNEITVELLREYYKQSKEDFYLLMPDLYWLGFRFTGALQQFQPKINEENDGILNINPQAQHISISNVTTSIPANQLKQYGVKELKDLQNFMLSSLRLHLKDDLDQFLQGLQKEWSEELILQSTDESQHTEKRVYRLQYFKEQLFIHEKYKDLLLNSIGINGCNKLIEELAQNGIQTLADFIEPLDGIHMKLDGVGPKAVRKFWDQLGRYADSIVQDDVEEVKEGPEKVVRFEQESFEIEEVFFSYPLTVADFPEYQGTIEQLQREGNINRIADLPNDFSELLSIKKIGRLKVSKFFHALQTYIDKQRALLEIKQLPDHERFHHEINLFKKWYLDAEQNRLSNRYQAFMQKKYQTFASGKHLTLEELGQSAGITRERVRQILLKGDEIVVSSLDWIRHFIQEKIAKKTFIMNVWFHQMTEETDFVILQALGQVGIREERRFNHLLLTTWTQDQFDEYLAQFKQDIKEHFALQLISHDALTAYCMEHAEEESLPYEAVWMIANTFVTWLSEDQAVLSGLKKIDIVEMVFLQFPEGVEIYKEEGMLIERANDLMPGSFHGERSFNSVCLREGIQDKLLLWGRGVYIHHKFVTVDLAWLRLVNELASKLLENEDFIHILKLYESVKKEAQAQNVPNEYALYTLLRLYANEGIILPKFPNVLKEGDERQSNAEWIIQFIEEKGRAVSYEELEDLFIRGRGWRKFTLDYNLSSNSNIIQFKYGYYTIISNYEHITKEQLEKPIAYLKSQMSEQKIITIHSAYEKFKLLIRSVGIETRQVFYYVLRRIGIEQLQFSKFPYINDEGVHPDELTAEQFVSSYLKEQEDIVAREEVEEWLEDVFGVQQNTRMLDIALVRSNDILYYAKGQYGEYIHRDIVGLTEDGVNEIVCTMSQLMNEMIVEKERSYILLPELYKVDKLPVLDNHISWSKELLGDVLKKAEAFHIFGSYKEIFTLKEGNIQSEVDLIEYILINSFKGAVKVQQLREYLMKIRYSKSGMLLNSIEQAIEKGQARFEIIGDEMIHTKLLEEV
ncbi:DUF4145 domain-containing protein [Lysinibacillus macroides]|uniref:RNA polymerase sigma-70 region 4 domain-containing protein n=1 Tax=Lysinibacillus macroides TaxID=33935 RepID=A0A0N0CVU1_9BACI|nr:DUF4145 domain-containing protein [Lysinibacillus macroides]KOY82171.1 hypothetical protein ADM90_11055 [Lysinibacillus macroides]QPR68250.1 DUF4145 domain-containing protein [Lysinibacillus macroides]